VSPATDDRSEGSSTSSSSIDTGDASLFTIEE
jgi:hypothetical protein